MKKITGRRGVGEGKKRKKEEDAKMSEEEEGRRKRRYDKSLIIRGKKRNMI